MAPQMPASGPGHRRINPDDVAAVKDRVRIDEVVGEYLTLGRPSGGNVKGLCPFHDEKTPSFNVTPSRGLFHCFGCGESGDAIDFVRLQLGLSFSEAVEYLAQRVGLQLRYVESGDERPRSSRSPKKSTKRTEFRAPSGALPKPIASAPAPASRAENHDACLSHEVAVYPYVDEHGEVLGEAVRLDCQAGRSKCFTQRHTAKGRIVNRAPERKVPYRLPELIEAIETGQEIYLPEGEKDADRIAAEGRYATTNLGGATSFGPAYVDFFRDARVVVVLDRDLAGLQRGLKILKLLTPVARTVRLTLPAVTDSHADISDHLDAGYDFDQLITVTPDMLEPQIAQLQAASLAAKLHTHLAAAELARDESAAQNELSHNENQPPKTREKALSNATRWAFNATKNAQQALSIWRTLRHTAAIDLVSPREVVLQTIAAATAAWSTAGERAPDSAGEILNPTDLDIPRSSSETLAVDGDDDLPPSNVIEHPTAARQGPPARIIPTAQGDWRFSCGDDGYMRGVYRKSSKEAGADQWFWVAPLPFVLGRVVRRRDDRRRMGTDFLIAATPDEAGTTFGSIAVKDGSWANEIGLVLPDDPKIIQNTATAIRTLAEEAPEREAVIYVPYDELPLLPGRESLPRGYLEPAPCSTEDALATWAQIVTALADSPRLALVVGASASAPYLGALERQSHTLSLVGDKAQGKTVALRLLGSIWGNSIQKRTGLVRSWTTTPIATLRSLGELGSLPPFFDEKNTASKKWTKDDWASFISQVAEGAQRTVSKPRSTHETVTTAGWDGIVFATGNGHFAKYLGAGDDAGIHRRIMEFDSPLTPTREHTALLRDLSARAYGHLGIQILRTFTAADVAQHITSAENDLGSYDDLDSEGVEIAKHLHGYIAGAAIIDLLAGTGETLRAAALGAARDYMESWSPSDNDGDRVIEIIRESLVSQPSRWPTKKQYQLMGEAPSESTSELPLFGVSRDQINGFRTDDGKWIAVLPGYIIPTLEKAGIDDQLAWSQLANRDLLDLTETSRRQKRWQRQFTFYGTGLPSARCYTIALSAFEDDDDPPPTPPNQLPVIPPDPSDVTSDPDLITSDVTSEITTTKTAVTSDVTSVTSKNDPLTRTCARANQLPPNGAEEELLDTPEPCAACGEPALSRWRGQILHPNCTPPAPSSPPAAKTPAPATPRRYAPSDRWSGPAVVLDVDGMHTPDGSVLDLPELTDWTVLEPLLRAHRIGWGGTKATTPYPPQVIVRQALAEQLGIPSEPIDLNDPESHATEVLPIQRATRDTNWELLVGQENDWRIRPWMRLARRGAGGYTMLIVIPHLFGEEIRDALFDADTPTDLILQRSRWYAETFGVPYRISPGVSAWDLANGLRANAGKNGSRPLPVLTSAVQQPRLSSPAATGPLVLRREPTTAERALRHVYRFDINASYCRAEGEIRVGMDTDPVHVTEPEFDKRIAGYYLVRRPNFAGMLDPLCPDPFEKGFVGHQRKAGAWRWLTAPRVRLLTEELGLEPEISEAWIWPESTRYFSLFNQRVVGALTDLWTTIDHPHPDLDRAELLHRERSTKQLYKSLFGRANRASHNSPLYRPDIHHAIQDEAFRHSWRNVYRVGRDTGRWPLASQNDSLWYATDDLQHPPAGLDVVLRQVGKYKPDGYLSIESALPFLDGQRPIDEANDLFRSFELSE